MSQEKILVKIEISINKGEAYKEDSEHLFSRHFFTVSSSRSSIMRKIESFERKLNGEKV
jgi:hypothetical protein